ncbi:MAG: PKD domain-containing protein [Methanoregulaceae archaeon]|nr:PKD domain-containing protein [Methanoregulaceae archaeon]NLH25231.1 PKD domain-containing protein [Methanomicrobiales archaeon]
MFAWTGNYYINDDLTLSLYISDFDSWTVHWDFGDGRTFDSTDTTPPYVTMTINYPSPGEHTITVTVTDSDGGVTHAEKTINLLSNHPPILGLDYDFDNELAFYGYPRLNQPVNFYDTSIDVDGEITRTWEFTNPADSFTTNEQYPVVTFEYPGWWDVQLIVIDDQGAEETIDDFRVFVSSGEPDLTADFTCRKNNPENPYEVTFYASSNSRTPIYDWSWRFDEEDVYVWSYNPPEVTRVYENPGVYTVDFTVCDDYCQQYGPGTVYLSKNIVVDDSFDPPALIGFTADVTEGYAPLAVQFTDISENTENLEWDFGDGTITEEENPLHIYTEPGSYTVTLTKTVKGVNYQRVEYDYIALGVAGFFIDTSEVPGVIDEGVTTTFFFNSVGEGGPFTWEIDYSHSNPIFEDASINSETGEFTWTPPTGSGESTYDLTVKVTDSNQEFLTATVSIIVNPENPGDTEPDALFSWSPIDPYEGQGNPYAGQEIQFTDKSTDETGFITAWYWEFGDGATSTEQNPVHVFSSDQTYTITLDVIDDTGLTSRYEEAVYVEPYPFPEAHFEFVLGTTSDHTTFTDTSVTCYGAAEPYEWDWDFGDGSTSTEQNPEHQYGEEGIYNVTLTVTNGLTDTCSHHIIITEVTPASFDIDTGQTAAITAAIDSNRVVWSAENTIYLYELDSGQTTVIEPSTVYAINPSISDDTIVWAGAVAGGDYDIYKYDVATGIESVLVSNPYEQHFPKLSGDYLVYGEYRSDHAELWSYNLNTLETTRISEQLSSTGVRPFDIDGDYGVYLESIPYTPYSILHLVNILTHESIQIGETATEKYNPRISGTRVVWEQVEEKRIQSENDVYLYDSTTGIVSKLLLDSGDEYNPAIYGDYVVWIDAQSGGGDVYVHNLVDDTTLPLTTDSESQMYPAIGPSTVIWEEWDSTLQTMVLKGTAFSASENHDPVASFWYDYPGSGTREYPIPGETVSFSDGSWDEDGDTLTWQWDFGDGTTSSEQTPAHYFNTGIYIVTLTVTDPSGASSFQTKEITITYHPEVSFTMMPEPPIEVGETITFTGTATDPDGSVEAIEWLLQSSTISETYTEAEFSYTFDETGLYLAIFTATDDLGTTSSTAWPVIVNDADMTSYFMLVPGLTIEDHVFTINPEITTQYLAEDIVTISGDDVIIAMNGLTTTIHTEGLTETDGQISGTIVSGTIENIPLEADIPDLGIVEAGFSANAGPESDFGFEGSDFAGIIVNINENPSTEVQSYYTLAASEDGLQITDTAYVFNILGATPENGVDVTSATVTMTAPASWVEGQGGPDHVRIFRYSEYDGTTEILIPMWTVEDGIYTFTAISPQGLSVFGLVGVHSQAPVMGIMVFPIDPIPVGSPVSVSAMFTDSSDEETHTALWQWGDGTESGGVIADGTKTVTGSHTYSSPGIYIMTLTVTDSWGSASSVVADQYIVIYDPSAGFVTGGGWIMSPEGAYAPDPTMTGKATFGFVSKYKKGATVPTGETEFQFKAGNLNFRSTSYDWLVVAGAKAMYKGTGTINGEEEYGFMLTAIDGQIKGRDSMDKFRIKIWEKATDALVYDNQLNALDTDDPTTVISGGSIVIHTK